MDTGHVSATAARAVATPTRRTALDRLIGVVEQLSILCGTIAVFLLLAAVLVVCHLVFVRYVLAESAVWQHEFVTYAVIGATFIGSPYVLLTRGHVNVDLVPHYLPHAARFGLALLAAALGLLFCALLAWRGYVFFEEAWISGETGATVWAPPLWIPRLAMPLGMGLMCLQYLADILALLTGREPPFGMPRATGT